MAYILYYRTAKGNWNRGLKGGKFWKNWVTMVCRRKKVDENTLVVVQGSDHPCYTRM